MQPVQQAVSQGPARHLGESIRKVQLDPAAGATVASKFPRPRTEADLGATAKARNRLVGTVKGDTMSVRQTAWPATVTERRSHGNWQVVTTGIRPQEAG